MSGIMDSAAYMEGGITELEKVLGTTRDEEYSRYEHVIYLTCRTREIYEANMANNPARSESFDDAYSLGIRIWEAWENHKGKPLVHCIPKIRSGVWVPSQQIDPLTWDEKWQAVKETIRSILNVS